MLKLLVVDDDEDSVELIRNAIDMGALGLEMTAVYDGIEALDYLTKHTTADMPDFVLMDLNMPRKDGRQLLAEMAIDERLSVLPVVLLSTTGCDEALAEVHPNLLSQCFSKPMHFQGYIDLLKDLYSRQKEGRLRGVKGKL